MGFCDPLWKRAPPPLHELSDEPSLFSRRVDVHRMARRDFTRDYGIALSSHPVLPSHVLVLRLQYLGREAGRYHQELRDRATPRNRTSDALDPASPARPASSFRRRNAD